MLAEVPLLDFLPLVCSGVAVGVTFGRVIRNYMGRGTSVFGSRLTSPEGRKLCSPCAFMGVEVT